MHVELVLPSLFSAVQGLPALPSMELLLARARREAEEMASLEEWLGNAFGLDLGDLPLPSGALTALAAGATPGSALWMRADPVHLRADRDRALILPNEAFEITEAEADALAGALEPLLAGKGTLLRAGPAHWSVLLEAASAPPASARAPIDLAGADVDRNLPAKAWHPLLTELQMAMYDHPVNSAREQKGEPLLNSLWLWGEGRLPARASGPWQSLMADLPAALGLARLAGLRHQALPADAAQWLERAPVEGRHLVILDALRGIEALGDLDALARRRDALEQHWFAPLLSALRAGRLGMVTVHVPDTGDRFEAVRSDLRRFWRRPRPLSSYAPPAPALP